ncbi:MULTISPECIES: histidine phosphatase family protein [Brevibacterium]|uniref:Phosphoglycerate mutase family protein n=2 Tax=Brevibacterium TaxID=1696 RepID=K9AVE6_9MICO|nr:histidine phosphatase family protein [Brevibacterium casei]EKU45410.1 phosphoglycerate mutase family protein [Brevibacterium casei S18]NJE65674.1 histidine phosphatase family protein [Brevibacterium sp. LS14]
MSTIHLVRHGEVDNPEGILYGRIPGFGLTERGHEMARRVSEHFAEADTQPVALVASPLLRAQQTMAPLSERLGLPVTTDDRVIEAANSFEGQKLSARKLSEPKNLVRLYNPLIPSWGEPYRQIVLRMQAAMASLRARLAPHGEDAEAVVVSHQLPIWMARLAGEGRSLVHDPRKRECALASVTSFTFDSSTLVSVSYENICADLQPGHAVAGA